MTGTSIDGLDAALVKITGRGLAMQAQFVRGVSIPLGELTASLREFARGGRLTSGEVAALALELGKRHAEALDELLGNEKADLIALHGQTVFHAPALSWQLINPWPVAESFRTKVVTDLRGADLAAGGEGAPITPLADFIIYRRELESRVILNLGGFANYTMIPAIVSCEGSKGYPEELLVWAGRVVGGDICICNQLLDLISRRTTGEAFDLNGSAAMSGRALLSGVRLIQTELAKMAAVRRSLGSGEESLQWIEGLLRELPSNDLARTACAAIAGTIAETIGKEGDVELVVAGGGVHNEALLLELKSRIHESMVVSDELDWPAAYREAAEMAILGALAGDNVAITLEQVTGRKTHLAQGQWIIPRW
jgi:1,6-anhydro-N-acetylmuramate kinase